MSGPAFQATPYAPRQASILKADSLAAEYKLQAAEALYQAALNQNCRNAGAWNGLGKIAYAKTTSSNQHLRMNADELHQAAIQDFLSALRYQPGYVEAHVNLASVYMDQGRMGEAADEIAKALQLASHADNVLSKAGEWLVRQGEVNRALPYLQAAIQRNSRNVAAHYYLAVAQINRNELDEALQNLQTTLWLQPRHAAVQYQLGNIYVRQGNTAAAEAHYLKAVAVQPEFKEARLQLAGAYEKRGDWSAALAQLKNAVDTANPDWEVIDRLGRLSVQNHQPQVAIAYYRQWLADHPADQAKVNAGISMAQTQWAKQAMQEGDLISQGEAIGAIQQAIHAQPNNVEARLIRARLDREVGLMANRPVKDSGMVDVALQQTAYQPYQSFERGDLLLSRYQFQAAEQAFRIARRTGEGQRNQLVFGELFLTKGLPALAEEAFHGVLNQLPDNITAQLGLLKAQQARDDSLELLTEARHNLNKNARPVAVMQLEKALRVNIKNADAHYLLAKLYERSDEYGSAADHYYAYLQLEPNAGNAGSVRRKIEGLKQKLVRQRADGGG